MVEESFFPEPCIVDPATFRAGEPFENIQVLGDEGCRSFYRRYADGTLVLMAYEVNYK